MKQKKLNKALDWRVFADTCVVNRIVEFGEYFFENYLGDGALIEYKKRPIEDRDDIDALHNIIQVYQRASLPLFISATVIKEVKKANNHFLESYAWEVINHWIECGDQEIWSRYHSKNFANKVELIITTLRGLKGPDDRRLVAEAIVMGCDAFLTVDRHSLWKRRNKIDANIRILRPIELWEALCPFAAII